MELLAKRTWLKREIQKDESSSEFDDDAQNFVGSHPVKGRAMTKRKLKLVKKELEEAYARNGRIDIELQEKEEYYRLACTQKRDAQRNLRLEQQENDMLRSKCQKLEKDLE